MFVLISTQQEIIKAEALEHPDREVCGYIMDDGSVMSCENIHPEPLDKFQIDTAHFIQYQQHISAIYHSHVIDVDNFSSADVALYYSHDLPLVLYSATRNIFRIADPSGEQPLEGRPFCYGINDCYSLVRDYFWQKLNIKLGNYPRGETPQGAVPDWNKREWDWIDKQFEIEGFTSITNHQDLQTHDAIAMSLGAHTIGIDHLAIYMGDDRIIHQLMNRPSRVDVWGDPWRNYSIKYLRHNSLI